MLCTEHAKACSGADYVLTERNPSRILRVLNELIAGQTAYTPPQALQEEAAKKQADSSVDELFQAKPAYDLYDHLDYAVILTSLGCPYRCTYCASRKLYPQFYQRKPEAVFQDILSLYEERSLRDFAFYDDALLVHFNSHLKPVLEQVLQHNLSCRFHTPNGLHARYIDKDCAELLFQAGFTTLRLSLETIDTNRQKTTGGKVTNEEFERAIETLKQTGFQGHALGAYLFVGLPGQEFEEVEATIRYAHDLGVRVNLCEYSPIPGTQDWADLAQQGLVDAQDDPLLHNNSVYLSAKGLCDSDDIQRLKNIVRHQNRQLRTCKD